MPNSPTGTTTMTANATATIIATGMTSVAKDDIASIDIRWIPDEKALLLFQPNW